MALVATVKDHWEDTKRVHVVGSIVATGNYVTGGDTVSFGLPLIKSNSTPAYLVANGLSKYLLSFVLGSNIGNGKIKITIPDTGLELAQAAYPAAITGDTITFYGIFHKHK